MKIQGLAIIFVIIILPITLILGEYASMQIDTFRIEQLYDSRLITATDDALKAFQINTFNDATSDIVDSKINSIEASVNAFYNSMESSFGLEGYSKDELRRYVPAIVYTMYDGYYIYSPYTNVADISGGNGVKIDLDSDNIEYGFKPYVYYSCRYKMGTDSDFIINYSLDNYITVQGMVDGESVYKSGYLVTIANSQNSEGVYKKDLVNGVIEYYYSGQKIQPEANLSENLVEIDSAGNLITKQYKYVKLNGTKYYWNESEEYIFYLMGGNRVKQVTKQSNKDTYLRYVNKIKINSSAIHYYEDAYEFTKWINNKLGNLETKHAITGVRNSGAGKIFKNENIEYPGSNFHLHRKEVIRYSVETNLSEAIVNFNNYTNSGTDFQMPKLKETEWEMLQNEISIISFLQGLNIGGKIYNGYTVITNNKTEEVVKEEKIYISTNDGYYHKINDKHFKDEYEASTVTGGFLDLDFEIRKDGATGTSYINRNELGCYTSIVGQENVDNKYDSIYEYLHETDIEDKIKRTYYTALGRERKATYKVENPSNIGNILDEMITTSDYDQKIVTDGLIRHLEANNLDGYGNNGDLSNGVWVDLSEHRDGIVYGAQTSVSSYVEFDGVDDWVDLGYIESPHLTLEATVEFPDTGSYSNSYILTNHQYGGIGLLVRNNKIVTAAYIDGQYRTIASSNTIQYNTKYNISVTYDGQVLTLYIYVNGTLERKTLTIPGSIGNPQENTVMAIGTNPREESSAGEMAKMKVYSIRIYDRGLTQDEIRKNYDFGKIVKITNVTATPSQGQWSTTGVTVSATASTFDISGINKIVYQYDYTPNQWFEGWGTATKNDIGNILDVQGTFNEQYKNVTLYLKAIDNAGNESDIVSVTLKNDSMAPIITNIQNENGNVSVEVQEQYVANKPEHYSGIEKIEYSYDNVTWATEDWDQDTPTVSGNIATITGTWDPVTYNNQTIYIRAIDYAGNISPVETIKIIARANLDFNLKLDGTEYYDGYSGITIGIKVGGEDKGYVSDYSAIHDYDTAWEIYGLQINGESVPYTASGKTGTEDATIWIELNTITFTVNTSDYGTISRTSAIVLKNTTYSTSGNTLTLSDGRTVTATVTEKDGTRTTFDGWSPVSGTVTAATTITANFSRIDITNYIDLNAFVDGTPYYDGYSGITVGLKVGGVDQGYVQDYYKKHNQGTTWEVYGIKINGESISYSSSGTLGDDIAYINIDFNTMTIKVNNALYGTVTRTSLIVLKNTTYTSSGNVLRISDGRSVAASIININNSTTKFTGWSPASGTVTAATTVTANFSRTSLVTSGLIRNYDGKNRGTTSGIWKDASGNSNGTINGGATFSNNALVLDGYDDWVSLGETGDTATALTWEVTFELDNPSGSAHILSDLGTTAGGVTIWYHSGALLFGAMIDGSYQSIKSNYSYLQTGTKYNVSATFDGSTMRLYINGELIASKENAGSTITMSPSHPIGLGASPWQVDNYAFTGTSAADAVFTDGKIYNARIYNRALTQAEIKQNIAATE